MPDSSVAGLVASQMPPNISNDKDTDILALDSTAFWDALLDGHRELRTILEPCLRSDWSMGAPYNLTGGRVASPVIAIRGTEDAVVSMEALSGWESVSSDLHVSEVAGGHLLLPDRRGVLLDHIHQKVIKHVPELDRRT